MKNIIRILAKIYFCYLKYRVRQFNTEYINGTEKCIICPNHSNKDDPAWILSSIKNTYAMAKLSLFKNKFYSIILHYLNTLPVKNNQINSIRNAIKLLENNKNIKLLIFIEKQELQEKKEN
ncbi:MAG: 1-acyl-sn-glycerol-3-phosphate acyltransferase [Neisseriaceae bacterium]|nr:1-acyl-sn-glycerol-3-phosphate acyltransferase [Neisseriaceae bacterium]